jgi:hypothetical protein
MDQNCGQISPFTEHIFISLKIDKMGSICYLRAYRQNPSNMVCIWIYVEQNGITWGKVEGLSNYSYNKLDIY